MHFRTHSIFYSILFILSIFLWYMNGSFCFVGARVLGCLYFENESVCREVPFAVEVSLLKNIL